MPAPLQVFAQFFVLGLTSFGGPVAHLGYFHERFVQRGVDVFTLQATLGHSSSATTGHYVAANPRDSSSLHLG